LITVTERVRVASKDKFYMQFELMRGVFGNVLGNICVDGKGIPRYNVR
jgi:hypothetical protein